MKLTVLWSDVSYTELYKDMQKKAEQSKINSAESVQSPPPSCTLHVWSLWQLSSRNTNIVPGNTSSNYI